MPSRTGRAAGHRLVTCLFLLPIGIGAAAAAPAAKPLCWRSADALVVAHERSSDTGQDIYVRTRPSAATAGCTFAPTPGDWRVGRDDPDTVLALRGRFLILDRGTGPDRTLLVLDVTRRSTLVTAGYDDREGKLTVADDGVTFWRVGPKAIGVAACPAAWRTAADNQDAKRAHPIAEVRFDFATRLVRETGRVDCLRTQDDMD